MFPPEDPPELADIKKYGADFLTGQNKKHIVFLNIFLEDLMSDIIELIKKQGEKRVSEIRELTGKLSEQLKHLISLIPEETRNKSLETFLNDIRTGVLGEKTPRQSAKGAKRAKKTPTVKRGRKKTAVVAAKRGRKKKEKGKESSREAGAGENAV